MARGHADALAPMVEEAMRGIEGGFPSLARIAVAMGPGSFTGIRIGLAMARAMGMALAIPVVGVSTLAAFAAPLLSEPRTGIIAATIDARHGSVYFQLFEASGRPLGPPRCDTPRECVRAIGDGPAWLAATPPRLSRAKRSAPDCRTTSMTSETRPTLSRSLGWALRSTRRKAPRAPFT